MRDYKYLSLDTFHLATRRPWKKIIMIIVQALLLAIIIGILIILIAIFTPEAEASNKYPWTGADTALELTLVGASVVDDAQTMSVMRRDSGYETNPLLGKHPSDERIIATSVFGLATHAVIAYILPHPWRTVWQGMWIGIEIDAVEHNRSCGTGVSLRF